MLTNTQKAYDVETAPIYNIDKFVTTEIPDKFQSA